MGSLPLPAPTMVMLWLCESPTVSAERRYAEADYRKSTEHRGAVFTLPVFVKGHRSRAAARRWCKLSPAMLLSASRKLSLDLKSCSPGDHLTGLKMETLNSAVTNTFDVWVWAKWERDSSSQNHRLEPCFLDSLRPFFLSIFSQNR